MGVAYNPRIVTDGLVLALDAGNPRSYDGSVIDEDLYTISSQEYRSAAIKTDGTLWVWGATPGGALGNAVVLGSVSTPVTTFAGGTNWKQISVGGSSSMVGIKTDGTLWVWGVTNNGQLGNGITSGVNNISTPITTFAGGTNWRQASFGERIIAAIKTDGTLWTWGSNFNGILGNAVTTNNISTPVTTFAGGTNWKQVSAAGNSSAACAAIKTDGTLWTWGYSSSGKLGNATNALVVISTPVTTFAGGTNWKQVSVGKNNGSTILPTAAIKTDGTLWIWGSSANGLLGNGVTTTTSVSTPITTFAGGNNWRQVNVGKVSVTAIKTDGTLWTWGYSAYGGVLGNTTTFSIFSTPVTTFIGGINWVQVSGGDTQIALRDNGTLWAWGNGVFGGLGNATTEYTNSTPVTIFAGGTNWNIPRVSGTNWTDLNRGSNNGTLVNGVGYNSNNGGSLVFGGVDGYVNLGTFFNYTNFTISLWVYPGSTQVQYADIFDNNHTGGQNFVCQQNVSNTNEYQFGCFNATNASATSVFTLTANTWQYLTFTWNNSVASAYINGVFHSSGAAANPINYSSQNLQLGGWFAGGRNWNGRMSNFMVHNRVLTPSEIQQNYLVSKSRYGI